MSINILTEPANPPISGDFTRDQAIQQACETPNRSILTDWEDKTAEPEAKEGAYIRHAGNTFQVQTGDESISGTMTTGINYIIATESSGVITLAWASSLSGYTYNPAYGGFYDSSDNQALADVCFYVDSEYTRGLLGRGFESVEFYSGGVDITAAASVSLTDCPSLLLRNDTDTAAYTLAISDEPTAGAKVTILSEGSNDLTVTYTASGGSHSFIMKDTEEVQLLSNGSNLLAVKGHIRLWAGTLSGVANMLYTTIFGNSGMTITSGVISVYGKISAAAYSLPAVGVAPITWQADGERLAGQANWCTMFSTYLRITSASYSLLEVAMII